MEYEDSQIDYQYEDHAVDDFTRSFFVSPHPLPTPPTLNLPLSGPTAHFTAARMYAVPEQDRARALCGFVSGLQALR